MDKVDPRGSGGRASLHRQATAGSLQTSELPTSQLPRANQPRMELSPDSAASNAFHAAALIRLVAEKPKKEDYSDYKACESGTIVRSRAARLVLA